MADCGSHHSCSNQQRHAPETSNTSVSSAAIDVASAMLPLQLSALQLDGIAEASEAFPALHYAIHGLALGHGTWLRNHVVDNSGDQGLHVAHVASAGSAREDRALEQAMAGSQVTTRATCLTM
mmetsp:Transcript_127498/g.190027  ORF Transcript_127498/g.190027 Transcript_127498/m.190027 type:complete len:123 (-) Transcript_127498:119-487(-)